MRETMPQSDFPRVPLPIASTTSLHAQQHPTGLHDDIAHFPSYPNDFESDLATGITNVDRFRGTDQRTFVCLAGLSHVA